MPPTSSGVDGTTMGVAGAGPVSANDGVSAANVMREVGEGTSTRKIYGV